MNNYIQALHDLPENTDDMTFTLHFMRIMNTFLQWMSEILYEARDQRENGESYGHVYSIISELHHYMTFYVRTVMRGEQINVQQMFTQIRRTRSRRN